MFYNKEYKLYIIDIHISEKLVNDSLKFFFFRSNNNNTLLKKIEFNNNISNDLLDKKMRIGFFLYSYAHFNEKKPIFFKVDEFIRFYFNLNWNDVSYQIMNSIYGHYFNFFYISDSVKESFYSIKFKNLSSFPCNYFFKEIINFNVKININFISYSRNYYINKIFFSHFLFNI